MQRDNELNDSYVERSTMADKRSNIIKFTGIGQLKFI